MKELSKASSAVDAIVVELFLLFFEMAALCHSSHCPEDNLPFSITASGITPSLLYPSPESISVLQDATSKTCSFCYGL